MSRYQFTTGEKLLQICENEALTISDVTIKREHELSNIKTTEQINFMGEIYLVMKDSVTKGINSTEPSTGGLIGENSHKMYKYWQSGKAVGSDVLIKSIAYALAITEENARMGKIAACPTAGACGVVPSLMVALQEQYNYTNQEIIKALFNSSAVGVIIATNASISGAEGGCQAEVGSASAMAASAMVELLGGSPKMCLTAAAIALKNTLGLVCDPVAGLVEVPCSKRNAMGVSNAFAAAHMSLAGIESFIKFDEVVEAMNMVGKALPSSLKETAQGGLAITKTARDYCELRNKD
ncbi:L-serine ammonia-lyase, iron-sulfur-dependent, subunit alpha [Clostridium sp. 'deep sea']|uniref:L-serine ammonia-lyase, iron-sulfur-dependent, subunit alpha n=1 Tax=Clostridium sp. 'deep sea' TaxID=2779445 RepID=UPI0018967331|nr:L-serine ammonia-lyase, iron-sulfur-dependent, subunit alpha [Clostridium sp. 'deep sea']QOR34194.1 L-serine ammonia-lyase, iron-sulfur-dependent, subunit alpha [Clostridium sp. 'deep sea']